MTYNNNHNLSQSKTEPKFYPLQTEENARACRELTKAQLSILYHLKTIDPDGDGVGINIKAIATELGLSKRTVSASLKVLSRLGWIELTKPDRDIISFR